jgi:hypothetical protein
VRYSKAGQWRGAKSPPGAAVVLCEPLCGARREGVGSKRCVVGRRA